MSDDHDWCEWMNVSCPRQKAVKWLCVCVSVSVKSAFFQKGNKKSTFSGARHFCRVDDRPSYLH